MIKRSKRMRVKLLRKKMGLTQEKFAQLLGVSWVTVARWEKKKGNTPDKHSKSKLEQLERKHVLGGRLRE